MKVYPIRIPEKHLQMMFDIAKNRGVHRAELFREAISEFLGTYSTIPSLKELSRQVERHEKEISDIKKALLKEGVI